MQAQEAFWQLKTTFGTTGPDEQHKQLYILLRAHKDLHGDTLLSEEFCSKWMDLQILQSLSFSRLSSVLRLGQRTTGQRSAVYLTVCLTLHYSVAVNL